MTKVPTQEEIDSNPTLAALQAIKYEDENPIGKIIKFSLLVFCLWIATLFTLHHFLNQLEVKSKPIVAHKHFPALGTGYMYLLQVLIGSVSDSVWLSRITAFILVVRHSTETTLLTTNHKVEILIWGSV